MSNIHQRKVNHRTTRVRAIAVQGLLMDVLTCADVLQTADSAHFFVFEEAMRWGGCNKPCCAQWH